MASGKTANYGLSQWEATDQVVRTDFNTDNAKIDAGIKSAQDTADNAQEATDNLAAVAFTPENLPFVVGTYTGDGATSRTINLGFTPRAVLLLNANGETAYRGTGYAAYYGGLALQGKTITCSSGTVIAIVEDGFQVSYVYKNDIACASNYKDWTFCYLAVK